MQRVGIIIPFSNLTVEEEFQRYLKNPEVIYQFFKLDYLTHKSDNEKKFYTELTNSLKTLTNKLSFTEFQKLINMCSSLNVQIDNKIFDSNIIFKEFLQGQDIRNPLLVSPYSNSITDKIIENLKIDTVVESIDLKRSIDYYKFGKNGLRDIVSHHYPNTVLVCCTNIPTMDLIRKGGSNLLSMNQAVVKHLNNLRGETTI